MMPSLDDVPERARGKHHTLVFQLRLTGASR